MKLTGKLRREALDKLRMLNGDYPHNGGGNICCGDGYFAQSIVRDFGMSITELAKACGYKPDDESAKEKAAKLRRVEAENRALKRQLAEAKAKGRVVDRIII